jgi:hypothetical protein
LSDVPCLPDRMTRNEAEELAASLGA